MGARGHQPKILVLSVARHFDVAGGHIVRNPRLHGVLRVVSWVGHTLSALHNLQPSLTHCGSFVPLTTDL